MLMLGLQLVLGAIIGIVPAALAASAAFPPARDADLVSLSTCDIPRDSGYSSDGIEDLPGYPELALRYQQKRIAPNRYYEVLLLVEKGESGPGERRCDRILAVQRVNLERYRDGMAIRCVEKDGKPPREPLVVGIGHDARPYGDGTFVARRAWAVDVSHARFVPLENRLLICSPEPPPP